MNTERIISMAKELFREERALKRLDGWFFAKEIRIKYEPDCAGLSGTEAAGYLLKKVAEELPLSVSDNAIFVGTQRDAFARSYALINPSFKVESFAGYCDPTAVFGDIEPNDDITEERIERVRLHDADTSYCRALAETYSACEAHTGEVAYFIEQVTGHVIPDVRPLLKYGTSHLLAEIKEKTPANDEQRQVYTAMTYALEALEILAARYRSIIIEMKSRKAAGDNKERLAELDRMEKALIRVPHEGARDLFEAIQSFMLIWQLMCLEQAPNPFAFSVGNADRIFEPYRAACGATREETAALLRHLLVFFNVGDRSWAISQNLMIGGKNNDGADLTNETSYALLDAYYDMNLPQPILSVKLHANTPEKLYAELGRFLFSPGVLTPSFFNDDAVFEILLKSGIDASDLPDYSVAGCQEPLIMGKDNGNTTNSWLNLGKILELTLTNGVSAITGKRILPASGPNDFSERLRHIRELFYQNLRYFTSEMANAANNASRAVSKLPVPFLSCMMGGIESGYDMRDTEHQGTKYNGSGCLIHGLSAVADSFVAIDALLEERPQDADRLLSACLHDFKNDDELLTYLKACPKFGNNDAVADKEAAELANKTADIVRSAVNYLGNHFRPDFSTPSTHLLYGYWVGALPNGRHAREMLNYGVDPLAGDAHDGLGLRTLSAFKLPYEKMCGGYASHFGVDPNYFRADNMEGKGLEFRDKVMKPLFFNDYNKNRVSPFYLYVNVTTPEILRKVLENPKKYAPSGVYIMRIHGTFVNFLDLSPAIQQDIIKRLDLKSTTGVCC